MPCAGIEEGDSLENGDTGGDEPTCVVVCGPYLEPCSKY